MTTNTGARRAHILLDEVTNGRMLERDEIEHLRSYLPAPPMQKTLQKIIAHVNDAWAGTGGNDWGGNSYDSEVTLEDWLLELHAQLQGLQDQQTAPEQAPALPEGMRLATHPAHGLCVVSPTIDEDGEIRIFYRSDNTETGADCRWVSVKFLTFLDSGEPRPGLPESEQPHPEFLENETEYEIAPNGTIVAYEKSLPWVKWGGTWRSLSVDETNSAAEMGTLRRSVVRWGYGNE